MQAAMRVNGVDLSRSSCIRHINRALNNNCVGISPQKLGGVALPSSIEKNIGMMVKHLREKHFPVFPEEVIKWTADAIENTKYADYFPNGIPTRGWY